MPERLFPGCNINGRICQKWTTIVVRISGVIMFARWLRSLRHLLGHTTKENHKKNAGHTMSTACSPAKRNASSDRISRFSIAWKTG